MILIGYNAKSAGGAAEFPQPDCDQYMKDETSVNRLVNEAFSQQSERYSSRHIFYSFPKTAFLADTMIATQGMDAYNAFKSGKIVLEEVAAAFSERSIRKNKSMATWDNIRFSHCYMLENHALHTLSRENFSRNIHGKTRVYIFKNTGERKESGNKTVTYYWWCLPAMMLWKRKQTGADFILSFIAQWVISAETRQKIQRW